MASWDLPSCSSPVLHLLVDVAHIVHVAEPLIEYLQKPDVGASNVAPYLALPLLDAILCACRAEHMADTQLALHHRQLVAGDVDDTWPVVCLLDLEEQISEVGPLRAVGETPVNHRTAGALLHQARSIDSAVAGSRLVPGLYMTAHAHTACGDQHADQVAVATALHTRHHIEGASGGLQSCQLGECHNVLILSATRQLHQACGAGWADAVAASPPLHQLPLRTDTGRAATVWHGAVTQIKAEPLLQHMASSSSTPHQHTAVCHLRQSDEGPLNGVQPVPGARLIVPNLLHMGQKVGYVACHPSIQRLEAALQQARQRGTAVPLALSLSSSPQQLHPAAALGGRPLAIHAATLLLWLCHLDGAMAAGHMLTHLSQGPQATEAQQRQQQAGQTNVPAAKQPAPPSTKPLPCMLSNVHPVWGRLLLLLDSQPHSRGGAFRLG